ncbi:MAG: DNA-binding response regulator [Acholeplasmataceae bacterium]|nr:MAG: DNA-binding response regulator [Acholeplasmataceae bacterium]
MPLIYFVEDDQAIAYIIEKTIANANMTGLAFSTGEAFLETFKKTRPDMVLLDVMLPDMSGIDLLKIIRRRDQDIPIMMISALQNEMDKVIALDAGADDYMTKPFGVLELTSRIQTKLRKQKDENVHELDNIILDDRKHQLLVDGREVYLTNKEYAILRLLLKQQGTVVSKEDIFKHVWETDFIGETRTLDMHIKSLREKLNTHAAHPVIKTIRGVGYQIG